KAAFVDGACDNHRPVRPAIAAATGKVLGNLTVCRPRDAFRKRDVTATVDRNLVRQYVVACALRLVEVWQCQTLRVEQVRQYVVELGTEVHGGPPAEPRRPKDFRLHVMRCKDQAFQAGLAVT